MRIKAVKPFAQAVRRHLAGASEGSTQRCEDKAVFSRIPKRIGDRLDEAGVPRYALVWAAHGGDRAEERAQALLDLLARGWSHAGWRELLEAA